MKQTFALDTIIIDKRYQARAKGLDETHVTDLMHAYEQADAEIDAPRVWNITSVGIVLTRGFHRAEALKRLGRKRVECEVKSGTVADALTDAASGNNSHGLKRTNADKKRSVEMVLEAHPDWSSRRVAEEAGVSHVFVAELRDVETVSTSPPKTPSNLKVDTLGRKQPAKKPKPETDEKKEQKESDPEPVNEPDDEPGDKPTDVQVEPEPETPSAVKVIESVCRGIDQLNRQLDEIKKEPLAYPVHFHSVQSALKNARETLWSSRAVFPDPYCKGTGKKNGDACKACRGTGMVIKSVNTQAVRAVGPVEDAA